MAAAATFAAAVAAVDAMELRRDYIRAQRLRPRLYPRVALLGRRRLRHEHIRPTGEDEVDGMLGCGGIGCERERAESRERVSERKNILAGASAVSPDGRTRFTSRKSITPRSAAEACGESAMPS